MKHTAALFPANSTPGIPSAAVGAPLPARPPNQPYVGYWARGVAAIGAAQWYHMEWNHHLPLAAGANLEFNPILNVLS